MVAREGTIARAGAKPHLGQPAISIPWRQLEHSLGLRLLQKSGRHLELSASGRLVDRYADEICRQHKVGLVSEIPSIKEQFYAISAERRLKHPAARPISHAARHNVVAKTVPMAAPTPPARGKPRTQRP